MAKVCSARCVWQAAFIKHSVTIFSWKWADLHKNKKSVLIACPITLGDSFLLCWYTPEPIHTLHQLYLILPKHSITLTIHQLTWCKWTTSDQEEWLKTCLPEFADAQVNKTTSKEFLPTVLRDWRNSWPTPTPTPEEITKASNIEKATQKKRPTKIWYFNHLIVHMLKMNSLCISILRLGSTIIWEEQHLEMVHVGFWK